MHYLISTFYSEIHFTLILRPPLSDKNVSLGTSRRVRRSLGLPAIVEGYTTLTDARRYAMVAVAPNEREHHEMRRPRLLPSSDAPARTRRMDWRNVVGGSPRLPAVAPPSPVTATQTGAKTGARLTGLGDHRSRDRCHRSRDR